MLYPTFSTIQKEEKAIVCDHLSSFYIYFILIPRLSISSRVTV